MKQTNTLSSISNRFGALLVGASAVAFNSVAMGQGDIVAWGYNQFGQCAIPAQSGVTAIACGFLHTIALKGGEVLAWGNNRNGQCTIPTAAQLGVTAIACGAEHTVALKGGTVHAWGDNSQGQCSGMPTMQIGDGTAPVQIDGITLTGVTAIACGRWNTIALKDGGVLAWGNNTQGQCRGTDGGGNSITDSADGIAPVQIDGMTLTGVTAIACGLYHGIALKNGAVLAWGEKYLGACNIPDAAKSGVTAIAGGEFYTVALKGGEVLAWGYNDFGQCNIPAAALSGVTAIACGVDHTIALKDGGVLAWGYNGYGECTIPTAAQSGVTAIAGGLFHTVALTDSPSLPCAADIDQTGMVDSSDLSLALLDVGICDGCSTDLDRSGIVDSADLSLVLLDYGPCSN